MDAFIRIALRLIEEQELLIGPIAWEQAQKVKGLKVNEKTKTIAFTAKNPLPVIEALIKQYEKLLGPAARQVCRDSVRDLLRDLPKDQIPRSLK